MENQPTLAYVHRKWTRAGPKMGIGPGLVCPVAQDCTRMGAGVKHPPKVTQNAHTERGNPSRALAPLCPPGRRDERGVSRRPGRMP
jgi:hypothetical protein